MCGIIGYIGKLNAKNVVVEGLKRLEYRGYDSVGIAAATEGIKVYKDKGIDFNTDISNYDEIVIVVPDTDDDEIVIDTSEKETYENAKAILKMFIL